jgi:hypothetical protein
MSHQADLPITGVDNRDNGLKNRIDLYRDWNKPENVEEWRAKSLQEEAAF